MWLDSIDGGAVDAGEIADRQLADVEPDLALLGKLARLQDDLGTDIRFVKGMRDRVERIAGIISDDLRNEEYRARLDTELTS